MKSYQPNITAMKVKNIVFSQISLLYADLICDIKTTFQFTKLKLILISFIQKFLCNQLILQHQQLMASILLILAAIPLALILYVIYMFVIKIYLDAAKFKKMDPTLKTFMAPFSGIQGVQKFNIQKYGDSHRFAKDLVAQNPQQNAYFTNIGYKPMLVVTSAKLIKQISTNPRNFKKFNLYKHSYKSYTKGIFLSEDEIWSNQRSIIGPSFNHDSLKKMIPVMDDSINRFLNRIKQQIVASPTKSRVFGIVHENQLMIGEILIRIFFSQQAMNKQVHGTKLSLAIADFTTTMFKRSRAGMNIVMQLFLKQHVTKVNFTKQDRRLQHLIDDIRVIILEIIQKRLQEAEHAERDFIQDYINQMKDVDAKIEEAEKQGKPHKYRRISKQQIAHQLISFYFAGIDTTGHLIAMALYALAEFPHCREKICEQLKQNIKRKEDLTYQNLQKLEYMNKFLDECLRMWPPAVGVLLRVARRDLVLGPYNIPKDTLVGTNIVGLMHNPKYYKNPQVFDPERWNDKTTLNSEPYSFIPFSAGQKSCIGKYLALMETKLIVIAFLNNFNIQRTAVPLRLHAKFLYEPIDQNLINLTIGGIKLGE